MTGRFNYRIDSKLPGIGLAGEPACAAAPEVAFATARLYWQRNDLNELADARQFVAITKRMDGGTNGLADRQMWIGVDRVMTPHLQPQPFQFRRVRLDSPGACARVPGREQIREPVEHEGAVTRPHQGFGIGGLQVQRAGVVAAAAGGEWPRIDGASARAGQGGGCACVG